MTRIEAYKLMLEGKRVEHHRLPGAVWSLGPDRKVRTNGIISDWNQEFLNMVFLQDGWKLHEPY